MSHVASTITDPAAAAPVLRGGSAGPGPVSVSLAGVSKTYGGVSALRPLDLEIRPGELLSLLGPSGCGKTTTLRILAGFIRPDTGRILLGERDVSDVAPNRRGLGMVFQSYSLFPHMTVGENVAYGLKIRGIGRAERSGAARRILDTVRLGGFEDRMPQALSGGQQQRVALARALVTRPSVLLLDEPLGALDKNLRERMQFEIRELQRRLAITTVLVTHDQEEAMTMSDRIAVLSEGALVQTGTPSEVYLRPRTRFVSEFLGTSNLLEGVIVAQDAGGMCRVRLADGSMVAAQATGRVPPDGGAGTVAIRPEKLLVGPAGGAGIAATVRDHAFRGSYHVYEFDLPGRTDTPIVAFRQAMLDDAEPGRPVTLNPDGDAVLLAE